MEMLYEIIADESPKFKSEIFHIKYGEEQDFDSFENMVEYCNYD